MNKTYEIFYRRSNGSFAHVHSFSLPVYLPVKSALEEIFQSMQGEVWSPNGEQRDYILSKGLTHTSMSVGDIVQDKQTEDVWKVEALGWSKVDGAPCV